MCLTCVQLVSPPFCGHKPPHLLASSARLSYFLRSTFLNSWSSDLGLIAQIFVLSAPCSALLAWILTCLPVYGIWTNHWPPSFAWFLHSLNLTLSVLNSDHFMPVSHLCSVICWSVDIRPLSDNRLPELSCIWNLWVRILVWSDSVHHSMYYKFFLGYYSNKVEFFGTITNF